MTFSSGLDAYWDHIFGSWSLQFRVGTPTDGIFPPVELSWLTNYVIAQSIDNSPDGPQPGPIDQMEIIYGISIWLINMFLQTYVSAQICRNNLVYINILFTFVWFYSYIIFLYFHISPGIPWTWHLLHMVLVLYIFTEDIFVVSERSLDHPVRVILRLILLFAFYYIIQLFCSVLY